jgi:hypothetical protein
MADRYPIVALSPAPPEEQTEVQGWRRIGDVDPEALAGQLEPIREAFESRLFQGSRGVVGFGLQSVEVSLTVTAEGGVGFIAKGSIEGSITLTFERPGSAN